MTDLNIVTPVSTVLDIDRIRPFLDTSVGEYSSYIMPVDESTLDIANAVRNCHIEHLANAGYQGYDVSIDEACHLSGWYFFVCKGGVVVQTSRVNFRSESLRFPFECGLTDAGEQYQYDSDDLAADINTYSVDMRSLRRASPLLLNSLGDFLRLHRVKRLYCLVDQRNQVIRRIYLRAGFFESQDFAAPIHFESFTSSVDALPTRWDIMEMGDVEIENLGAARAQRFAKTG